MQQLEQEYLKALNDNYHKEKTLTQAAKLKYIFCAKKIQRAYRMYKFNKLTSNVTKLQRNIRIWLRIRYYQRKRLRQLFSVYAKIKIVKKIIQKTLLKRIRNQSRLFKPTKQYPKSLILRIQRFCKNIKYYKIRKVKRQNKELTHRILFCILKNKQKTILKQEKNNYYKAKLQASLQQNAITNEIKFLENVKQTNQQGFEMHWKVYEQNLVKFLEGRQRIDDWVPQKDEYGEQCWVNLKTLEKSYTNPVEKYKIQNINTIKRQAEIKLQNQMKYLDDQIENLEELRNSLNNVKPLNLSDVQRKIEQLYKRFFVKNPEFSSYFKQFLK